MKLIKAIIQPYKLTDVKEALSRVGVTKMTVTNALGCGQQQGYDEVYRGVVHEVHLLKKIAIEIAVNEEYVEKTIIAIIEGAKTGRIGDGKIFISNLEDVIRIRTHEKGEVAVG
ncbi:MAG: P-II family nitrogen regulator [Spirochaetia bacterium]|nr:P-II family nitrogen regulator [Spirochaetia bacterium]